MFDSLSDKRNIEVCLEDVQTRIDCLRRQRSCSASDQVNVASQLLELSRTAREISSRLRENSASLRVSRGSG